jgi:hypothetical protein
MKKIALIMYMFAVFSLLFSVQIQFVGEVFTEAW